MNSCIKISLLFILTLLNYSFTDIAFEDKKIVVKSEYSTADSDKNGTDLVIGEDGLCLADITYKNNNTTEAQLEFVSADPDGDGTNESFFVMCSDITGINNRMILTETGALVIGEDGPCQLSGTLPSGDPLLMLKDGAAVNQTGFWDVPQQNINGNARMANPINNDISMGTIQQLKLYPDEAGVRIGMSEAERALPESIGQVEINGESFQTFNGSQLFYHFIGAIKFLKNELEIKETRIDQLEESIHEIKRKLDKINPQPERPHEDKKAASQSPILKVFPNPTRNNMQVEINTKEKLENAKLQLIDAAGNLVLTQQIGSKTSAIILIINNLNIQSGQYFCTLISAGKIIDTQTITIVN